MKKLVLILCVIFMGGSLVAQDDLIIEQIRNTEPAIYPEPGSANSLVIGQFGSENKVNVDQLHSKTMPFNNQAVAVQEGNINDLQIIQDGSGNFSLSVQQGDDNKLYLEIKGDANFVNTNQFGSNNSIFEIIKGNRNYSVINQIGDNNSVRAEITGDDIMLNESFPVNQIGNNNSLMIKEDQPNNMGIIIEQNGNGMQMQVERTNIYRK